MANLFLTSDEHLGHFNIIRYCSRPFKTLEEMNETIINNHNERVKKDDTIIINGDFCFRNSLNGKQGEGSPIHSKNYIERLNGRLIFVKGNHDGHNSLDTKIEKLVLTIGGIHINVCHNPKNAIVQDEQYYYPLNLIGHIHEKWVTQEIFKNNKYSLLLNVGVDVHKFRPISFDEVKAIFDKWLSKHPHRKKIQQDIEKDRINARCNHKKANK